MGHLTDFAVKSNYIPVQLELNYFKAAGMGWIEGVLSNNKYAHALDIDIADCPADIWPRKHNMTWSDVGVDDIDSISSSSTSDVGNIIQLYGLDAAGDMITEFIALNGQTRVALVNTYQHVWRMVNMGSTDLDGVAYVYVNSAIVGGVPSDDTKIRCLLDDGDNQSLISHFRVPHGYYFILNQVHASIVRAIGKENVGCSIDLRVRLYDPTFGQTSWQTKGRIGLDTGGTNSWHRDYPMFAPLGPEFTDVKIQVHSTTDDNCEYTGAYDFVLVKNEFINETYLQSIAFN